MSRVIVNGDYTPAVAPERGRCAAGAGAEIKNGVHVVSSDEVTQRDTTDAQLPVRETHIRTTVVALDIAQLVVAALVVGIYGVVLILRGTAPGELTSLVFVIVGAVVAKKLPS